MRCGILQYDDSCKFKQELFVPDLAKAWGYYVVRYKKGNPKYAVRIDKGKLEEALPFDFFADEVPPSVKEKLEFDFNGHIIQHEINFHQNSSQSYELCRLSYKKKMKETHCYDRKGNLTNREVHVFKGNMLEKSYWYKKSGELIQYSIFDHETWTVEVFSPDHKLLKKRDMRLYLD